MGYPLGWLKIPPLGYILFVDKKSACLMPYHLTISSLVHAYSLSLTPPGWFTMFSEWYRWSKSCSSIKSTRPLAPEYSIAANHAPSIMQLKRSAWAMHAVQMPATDLQYCCMCSLLTVVHVHVCRVSHTLFSCTLWLIMPRWAEPQRHTVVIVFVCVTLFCQFLNECLKVSAENC